MNNINLNPGGLIGALVAGGITAAILFSVIDPGETNRAPYKIFIFTIIGGAFAGNFLWAKLVSDKKE